MREMEWCHITAVIPRESGESSKPRPLGSITDVSEYWIARSSRAMTTEFVMPTFNLKL